MNKRFSKSSIIPPLELTLDYIVLHFSLPDTTILPMKWKISWITSFLDITAKLNQYREKLVNSTSRKGLWEVGLHARTAVQKPLLRKQNHVERLQSQKDWTIDMWNKVLWTDESKFEIFGTNRRAYVRLVKEQQPPVAHQNALLWYGGLLPIVMSGICNKGRVNWMRPAIITYRSFTWTPWNTACGSRICTHGS